MFARCMVLVSTIGLAAPLPLSAADLNIEIRGLPSPEGTVDVAIFDAPTQFLAKPAKGIRVSAGGSPLVVTFADLQPGTYAVSTFHDANGNGALDKNLFGRPTEKYGFSRDAAGAMRPPEFEDAALAVGSDDLTIIINLR
jgi:uncharacterized protein (DUF2141 family)